MYLEENLKLTPHDLSDKASAEDEVKEMHQQVTSFITYSSSAFKLKIVFSFTVVIKSHMHVKSWFWRWFWLWKSHLIR